MRADMSKAVERQLTASSVAQQLIPDLWRTCSAKIAREPEIWDQFRIILKRSGR
jgi:hypothetical protein